MTENNSDARSIPRLTSLVEVGDPTKIGAAFQTEFLALKSDREAFISVLRSAKDVIDKDTKSDKNLPNIDIVVTKDYWTEQEDLRVSIDKPGEIFGNFWRDKEEVFADIRSGKLNFGGPPLVGGSGSRNESVIAEKDSVVRAIANSHVIAKDGSFVEASGHSQVTAEYGSEVRIWPDHSGDELVQITAKSGSIIDSRGNASIDADPGSRIYVCKPLWGSGNTVVNFHVLQSEKK